MDASKEFVGSLYRGDQATKGWTQIGGNVCLAVVPCRNKKWKLEAKQGREKIWENQVVDGLTCKLRDNFVQWQYVTGKGERITFGFRIKDVSLAQEFADLLSYAATHPAPSDEKELTIMLPSKERTNLSFNTSTTMVKVLKHVTSQYHLDSALFALAAVEEAGMVPLKPQTTVGDLKSSEIAVVRRQKSTATSLPPAVNIEKPKEFKSVEEETIPLEVTIPSGTTYTVHVKPSIVLSDLLRLICADHHLNPAAHIFKLPIANQDKVRLKQLKISSISLIRKEGISGGVEVTDGCHSPLKSKTRIAPPPPKPPTNNKYSTSPSLSPSSYKHNRQGHESTDGTMDVNVLVSRMLQEQAIGGNSPSLLKPQYQFSQSPLKTKVSRKLNPPPAPPPHKVAAKKDGSTVHSEPKRTAPPPPDGSVSPLKSREEVDSGQDKQHHVPHGIGVALPCMTRHTNPRNSSVSRSKQDKSPRIIIKKEHSLDDSVDDSPSLGRVPPSSLSPVRRAPMKPAPKLPPRQRETRDKSPGMLRKEHSLDSINSDSPSLERVPPSSLSPVKRSPMKPAPKLPPRQRDTRDKSPGMLRKEHSLDSINSDAPSLERVPPSSLSPVKRSPMKPAPKLPPRQRDARDQSPGMLRKEHSRDSVNSDSPSLDMVPPSSLSPMRKPKRKAPIKPAPQLPPVKSGDAPSQQELSDNSQQAKGEERMVDEEPLTEPQESHIVVATPQGRRVDSVTANKTFVFNIPPPPPRRPPPKELEHRAPEVAPIQHVAHQEEAIVDYRSSDDGSSSSTESSSNGGYNIGSTNSLDKSDTSSSESEDEKEETDQAGQEKDQTDYTTASNLPQNVRSLEEKENKKARQPSILVSEPESGSSDGGEEGGENGGIRLISHTRTDSLLPQEDMQVLPVDDQQDTSISPDTDLPLDNRIKSLKNLVEDTCQIGGKDRSPRREESPGSTGSESELDISMIKKMMVPPPDTPFPIATNQISAPHGTPSSQSPPSLPTPPTVPPPPPTAPPPPPPKAPLLPTVPIVQSNKPPPPTVKPKPPPLIKPKPKQTTTDDIEAELKAKLVRRQQIIEETKSDINNLPNGSPSVSIPAPPLSPGAKDLQSQPLIMPSAPGSNPSQQASAVASGSGGDMQLQLQLLQQQMLQQQMMQLQQQFQQFQSMMAANGPFPGMNPLLQQQMQTLQGGLPVQYPGIATPFTTSIPAMVPQGSMVPPPALPLVANQPITTTASLQPMNQQSTPALQQPFPLATTMSAVAPLVTPPPPPCSPPPVPPPAPPPPPIDNKQADIVVTSESPSKSLSRKPSEADVRMQALGTATEKFDNLMDEVRETNPSDVLRKAPTEDEREQPPESAYTGMTAALVEAMRERRKSFQDTSFTQQESVESNSEWEEEES